MKELKPRSLVMAVEFGHDINVVAQQYVQQFNESGGFVIEKYSVRKPTEEEIAQLQKRNVDSLGIVKKGDEWFSQSSDGRKIVAKPLFVIEIQETRRLPMDLEKLKLLKAEEKLKSVKGVGR